MQGFYEYYKQQMIFENNNAFINALEAKCKKLDFRTRKFDYVITDEDLYDMFEVLNKFAFNGLLTRKIKISAVKFDVNNKSSTGTIWKGRHGVYLGKTEKGKKICTLIEIAVRKKDNPFMILCVLAHEMIHELDTMIGPYLIETLPDLDGSTKPYDSHGNFFKKHMDRINKALGLNIMIKYDETDEKRLVQIDDSDMQSESKESMKKLANKAYDYLNVDGYKEIEWRKDGFILWQE